ncbi:DUF5677 domain-containing protein [Lactiplantibacillus plantarum]|uniref:DUF5677 domain-containing protein n=1 Tax=Lactiplantibacillus plantarum TaxID=1590 RepID=UPI003C2EDABE
MKSEAINDNITNFKTAINQLSHQYTAPHPYNYQSLLFFLTFMLEQLQRINISRQHHLYSGVHSATRTFFESYAYFLFIIKDESQINRRLTAYQLSMDRKRYTTLLNTFNFDSEVNPDMQEKFEGIADSFKQTYGLTPNKITAALNDTNHKIKNIFKPKANGKSNNGKTFYSLDGTIEFEYGSKPRKITLNTFKDLCDYLDLGFVYQLLENEESTEIHGTDILNSFTVQDNGEIIRNPDDENDFPEQFVTLYLANAITALINLKGINKTPIKNTLKSIIYK